MSDKQRLCIEVVGCENLLSKDSNGFSDPFVVITCDQAEPKKVRTRVVKKSLNPDFHETFWIICEPTVTLTITVYDWDRWSSNDVCGTAILDLAPFQLGPEWKACSVPLVDRDVAAGCIQLQLLYENRKDMFGLDLQTLCEREKLQVPSAVVTMCQALSQRADTEGIYRVPGMLSEVKALTRCFNEGRHPKLPETGVDVLVWASCLKSFFSELPAPLLTNALYPEYVAAMRGSQDRSSQTTAMCGVLRKLPPPFRTTAAHLIRHLREVASQEEVNKMSYKNLAVCFAPTILSPPPPEDPALMMKAMQAAKFDEQICELMLAEPDILEELEFPYEGGGKLPELAETRRLRSDPIAELHHLFMHHASPLDVLSYEQFRSLGLELGIFIDDPLVYKKLCGGKQVLGFDAFLAWWTKAKQHRMSPIEWAQLKLACFTFKTVDKDGSGTVDEDEFKEMYPMLQQQCGISDDTSAEEVLQQCTVLLFVQGVWSDCQFGMSILGGAYADNWYFVSQR
eukprot:m.87977 g.87977  ORF g.87977 m.87977 type:complete len:510 (-) comp14798_c0_seq2:51-1580(-)